MYAQHYQWICQSSLQNQTCSDQMWVYNWEFEVSINSRLYYGVAVIVDSAMIGNVQCGCSVMSVGSTGNWICLWAIWRQDGQNSHILRSSCKNYYYIASSVLFEWPLFQMSHFYLFVALNKFASLCNLYQHDLSICSCFHSLTSQEYHLWSSIRQWSDNQWLYTVFTVS